MLGIVKAEFVAWAKAYDGPRFHAVLCDPPYGLKFMGKDWDRVSAKEWGDAMMPLLYPGAIVLMFGGTRTWHKLATGMEEAGFEIWDTLMWLHGQGFPKAQDIGKLIDKSLGLERTKVIGTKPGHKDFAGRKNLSSVQSLHTFGGGGFSRPWMNDPDKVENYHLEKAPASESGASWSGHKTAALKPSWEPILCFRAPRQGKNYAELAMEYGSGALIVDGGRIDISDSVIHCKGKSGFAGGYESKKYEQSPTGRYPANLVLDEESAELLDEQRPFTSQTGNRKVKHRVQQETMSTPFSRGQDAPEYTDSGGPSRFFYCAKASRSEREAGLEGFDGEQRDLSRRPDQKAMNDGEGNPYNRGVVKVRNNHPTVKPITLIKWLATLLLPPDSVKPRRLLVPFAGVASEMIGAMQAGWDEVVGVEQDSGYSKIARCRLEHWEC